MNPATTDIEALQSSQEQRLATSVEWSAAAVRLLQSVVYHDDKIGLLLVVDEAEGMAYLRQLDDDEITQDSDSVPRLFRRTPLGYEASLLCVVLRDLLRQFEEEDVKNERCVVSQDELLAMWKALFSKQTDEVKLNRTLQAALRKLEELKFVRQFEDEPPSWEIRRILKARLPLSELEQLKISLMAAVDATKVSDAETASIE
jgi:hypothetical protein